LALPLDQQAALRARLAEMLRENRYDPATQTLTIDPVRARAFESNLRHYAQVFGAGQPEYAIPKGVLTEPTRQHALAAFFFWTAWSATALRPGEDASYTSNWPHEPLLGNGPTGDALVWTGVSVLVLLAGIGAFVWYYAGQLEDPVPSSVPVVDPMPRPPASQWSIGTAPMSGSSPGLDSHR
jgi:nitric oxide reductase subunit B